MKKLRFLAFLMMGIIACFGMTSCGDDDDDDIIPEEAAAIIGTWETSYQDDDEGEYETVYETFTFKKNGTFVNTIKCKHYNDKITGLYEVRGDLSAHAFVIMDARDDGKDVRVIAEAYIIDNVLVMTNDENETYRFHRK